MIELLSPVRLAASPARALLAHHGIQGGWNYALDHAWLYARIEAYLACHALQAPVILDVGCGNSMLHPFLEQRFTLGIIGIDRLQGLCPHPGRTQIMDWCGDFQQVARRWEGMADIVFWCSSLEHNRLPEMREGVEASLLTLKPGGLVLATIAYAPTTRYFAPSEQMLLNREDAESILGVIWKRNPDFDAMVAEYRLNLMDLDARHTQRYGTREYAFVVAGAELRREGP